MAYDPGKGDKFENKWLTSFLPEEDKTNGGYGAVITGKASKKQWKVDKGEECWIKITVLELRDVTNINERCKSLDASVGFDVLGKDKQPLFKVSLSSKSEWKQICYALSVIDKNSSSFAGCIKKEDLFSVGMLSEKAFPEYEKLRSQTDKLWQEALSSKEKPWPSKKEITKQWGLYIIFNIYKKKP